MITLKPATSRLTVRVASTAFAALLALGLPLAAQSRGGHGGGGGGGDRSAHSSGGGSHSSSGGDHSSGGRTAHGTPGGSSSGGQRQPGHGGHGDGGHGDGGHGGRGDGGHGGHGGGGYWRGGHFYYYPFGFGFGFWPGYWDGWYGGGYYGDPYYYPYYRGDGGYYNRERRDEMGALDLDVSPGRTHVFVNGEDLGIVDKYDGWPGYLWLPEGTYDIAFYLPGYKTIARQITIYPGSVIDIDDGLEKGESVRPEDLVSKSHVRRDDRLRYERERQEWLDRRNGDNDDDQDWHDRVRHERGTMHNDQDRDDDHGDDRGHGRMQDDSAGSHLRLSVQPQDASVYLDGQFVGTGTDLSLLHSGLPVAPGHHKLAVVRPGHKAIEKEFDVKSGGNLELEISLESGSR